MTSGDTPPSGTVRVRSQPPGRPAGEPSPPPAREIRTFLDPGTAVNGKLAFSTPTRIEGRLKGEVRATELLVIAAGGLVQGTIWPRHLIVEGEVRGEVREAERVEVHPGGRLVANVETRTLVIADGASFEGDCRMTTDAGATREHPARS